MTAQALPGVEVDPRERPRCSDTSRARSEAPLATAPPAGRLLLIEAPGPWGRAGLTASRLTVGVTRPLAERADAAGVRVQLIRRPGRHAGPRRPGRLAGEHAWALADPAAGVVRWGVWSSERDLLTIPLDAPIDAADAASGPQRLALVCTHAKHDVCCAVRGRPVAAALATIGPGDGVAREVWETSHLGGDRFAANVLLLPEGEVFGGLDEDSALAAVRSLDAGRLDLAHYRGRVGRSPAAQAALHLAAVALDDDRRDAVRLLALDRAGATTAGRTPYRAGLAHAGSRYRLEFLEWWTEPELLTCAAVQAKPARRFTLVDWAADDRSGAKGSGG